MAKVRGPLISLDSHGQLGKTIVFSKWKNIPYVRAYVIPKNPRTPQQVANRDRFRWVIQQYHIWAQPNAQLYRDGYNWIVNRKRLSMPGIAYFVSVYMTGTVETRVFYSRLEPVYTPEDITITCRTSSPNRETEYIFWHLQYGWWRPWTYSRRTSDDEGNLTIVIGRWELPYDAFWVTASPAYPNRVGESPGTFLDLST
jgi:hypothetical protein